MDRFGDNLGLVAVDAAGGPCRPSASITVGSRATVTGRGDPAVATEARGGAPGIPSIYCGKLRTLIRRLHRDSVGGMREIISAFSRSVGFTRLPNGMFFNSLRAASPT